MLGLLETNAEFKNLKKEIMELFPNLSPYIISSIYTETLRGQIKKREFFEKEENIDFKWKKIYHENPEDKKNYKKYIIKLPNLFENICSDEISRDNLNKNVDDVIKVLALICREKSYGFERLHGLTLLVLWNQVGRFRTIKADELLHEINRYSIVEQKNLDEILNDLFVCGLVVKFGVEYGIRREIKL